MNNENKSMDQLLELGYTPELEKYRLENLDAGQVIGRVVAEHKERYTVRTAGGEYDAEITGNMRFTAAGREDFPAVGDWVALTVFDSELAVIHRVLPRTSVIRRQAVGQHGEVQIIATNIDMAFIVQAADRDFNVNRLERYLTICYDGRVDPVIVLTKTDLISEPAAIELVEGIRSRIREVPVVAVSNETRQGYESILQYIGKGKTCCLLGSSGVGKSTLLNNLSGRELMKTGTIGDGTHRGRHITSRRELFVLENGGILIDNPGMREVGIADQEGGMSRTFDLVSRLAVDCRFPDCTHTGETGCAVMQAVETGELDQASYENYLRMERERAHFESSSLERRKKERTFGKMLKNYKKDPLGGK